MNKNEIRSIILAIVLAFAIPTVVWFVASHFEAKTYRELTGKEVSTWQAMWVELRIVE